MTPKKNSQNWGGGGVKKFEMITFNDCLDRTPLCGCGQPQQIVAVAIAVAVEIPNRSGLDIF